MCVVFQSEHIQSPIKRCLPKDGPTWRINLSFTEYHVYSLIDKYCRGLNFRHVLVLMNILREENKSDLAVINNELLVNALFNVSQKYIDKLRTKEMWVHMVMETLSECLKNNFLPSFYMPRQNLLNYYQISEKDRNNATHALDVILQGIQKNPRTLYKFSGSVDPNQESSNATRGDGQTDTLEGLDEPDIHFKSHVREPSEGEEEETGFYEDQSAVNSGWPIEAVENRSAVNSAGEDHRDNIQEHYQQMFEEDSGISKHTRVGERSDIY